MTFVEGLGSNFWKAWNQGEIGEIVYNFIFLEIHNIKCIWKCSTYNLVFLISLSIEIDDQMCIGVQLIYQFSHLFSNKSQNILDNFLFCLGVNF